MPRSIRREVLAYPVITDLAMRDNWFYGLALSSSDLGLLKKELRDMGILLWDKRGNDQWNHAIDI